jgi:hypothetical protein
MCRFIIYGIFLSVGLSYGQVILPQGSPPLEILSDPRILPIHSTSKMQIFYDGDWRDDVDSHFDPSRPTLMLVHGWRRGNLDSQNRVITYSIYENCRAATTALRSRIDDGERKGDINLLAWNWTDTSSTQDIDLLLRWSVLVPSDAICYEGILAAAALDRLNPKNTVHLLGHSLGSKLASVAGCWIKSPYLDQVSLLDGPELNTQKNIIRFLIDTVTLHQEDDIRLLLSKNIFVDSYSSAFCLSYQEYGIRCADINMKPPISFSGLLEFAILAHGYPLYWYFGGSVGTLGNPLGTVDLTTGDVSQDAGAIWSEVINRRDSSETISSYRKKMVEGDGTTPITSGLQYEMFSREQPYRLVPVASVRAEKNKTVKKLEFSDSLIQWNAYGNVTVDSLYQTAALTADKPVCLFTSVDVPEGNVYLQFDFAMTDPQPDDRLTVYISSRLLFSFLGQAFPSDAATVESDKVDITGFNGQNNVLTFCFSSSKPGKTIQISNVKLVSEPILPFYDLKSSSLGGGYIFPVNRTYEEGTKVTLTALPDDGYDVFAWKNVDSFYPDLNHVDVLMMNNEKVEVSFIDERYPHCTGLGFPAIVLVLSLGFWLIKR